MKKIQIYLFALLLAMVLNSSVSNAQTFEKGTKLASLGVGLGTGYSYGIQPSIQGMFDMGITNKLGIGNIGIGGIIAFSAGSKNYFGYKSSSTNLSFAIRASYHFDLDIDKVDLYAGVLAGYNISNRTTPSYSNVYGNVYGDYNGTRPVLGVFAGARYYVTPKFAVFAELASDIVWTNIGLTLKF